VTRTPRWFRNRATLVPTPSESLVRKNGDSTRSAVTASLPGPAVVCCFS